MISRKNIFLLVFFSFAAIGFFYFYPSDEKRLKNVISDCEEAIAAEDIDRLMAAVSYNYKDDEGNGYIQIKEIMTAVFKHLDDIEIEREIARISVSEDNGEAELSLRVVASAGEERGYVIGDAAKYEGVKVFFEKSPYKWLVTKIKIESFGTVTSFE